jgi:TRAP-type C4-dicarboxylate transport system substrate-binding protein
MHRFILALAALALAGILSAAPAGPAFARTVRLGIVTTPGSAQHVCATAFQDLAAQRSGGAVEVKIFHSGTLGSETDILRQVQMGAVDMAIVTLGPLDTFVPEAAVVGFPFLFASPGQADAVLDGPLGAEILTAAERAGFKGLAFSENGFRNLTNAVRPSCNRAPSTARKIRCRSSGSTGCTRCSPTCPSPATSIRPISGWRA